MARTTELSDLRSLLRDELEAGLADADDVDAMPLFDDTQAVIMGIQVTALRQTWPGSLLRFWQPLGEGKPRGKS